MEQPVVIVPLTSLYQSKIEAWASDDAGGALFKQSGTHLADGQDSRGWAAVIGSDPIGAVTISRDPSGVDFMYVIVKPSERRHGLGASLVKTALDDPETKKLTRLHAYVEPENTAAQKILIKRGFSQIGYGPDGQIEFELH